MGKFVFKNKNKEECFNKALAIIKASNLSEHIFDVFLFGSVAKKTDKFNSDIDIAIILNTDKTTEELLRKDIHSLKRDFANNFYNNTEIDAKFYFTDSWLNSNNTFFRNIKKEGFSIWH